MSKTKNNTDKHSKNMKENFSNMISDGTAQSEQYGEMQARTRFDSTR